MTSIPWASKIHNPVSFKQYFVPLESPNKVEKVTNQTINSVVNWILVHKGGEDLLMIVLFQDCFRSSRNYWASHMLLKNFTCLERISLPLTLMKIVEWCFDDSKSIIVLTSLKGLQKSCHFAFQVVIRFKVSFFRHRFPSWKRIAFKDGRDFERFAFQKALLNFHQAVLETIHYLNEYHFF